MSISNRIGNDIYMVRTIKDTVTDSAMTIDIGMKDGRYEAALRRKGRKLFRHVEIQKEG